MKKFFFILLLAILPVGLYAQEAEIPLRYWGKPTEFITEQAEETFHLVNQMLSENPPSSKESLIRKSALLHVDWILHDTRLDDAEPVYVFMKQRMQAVLDDLNKPVKKGMKIYKLYNHTFIAKTKSVTIAFDMYRGGKKGGRPLIPNDLMQAIVAHCDVMFVSHEHSDHADWEVAQMFVKAGKSVIVPTGLWEDKDSAIKHMRSAEMLEEKIKVSNEATLSVKIMPGHQDNVKNNIYIVTVPEGISVAHTGDQWSEEDKKWIDKIKEHTKLDVLLVHCWSMPLERIVNGLDPQVVITGHENEVVHSVDHREPYWLNYRRMQKVSKPKIFMTWGENFLYVKGKPVN